MATLRNNDLHRLMFLLVLSAVMGLPSIAAAQSIMTSQRSLKVRPRVSTPRVSTALASPRATTLRSVSSVRSVTNVSRSIPAFLQAPRSDNARVETTRVTVELNGSYSALVEGDVAIRRGGSVIARGSVSQPISVPGGSPVDIVVTATNLVDQPSITRPSVALPAQGGALTIQTSIATGLIRAVATIDGRTVSGVVRLYRINPTTGTVSEQPCGSIGANGGSREISTGRYRAILSSNGQTLTRDFDINVGSSRLVRLEG